MPKREKNLDERPAVSGYGDGDFTPQFLTTRIRAEHNLKYRPQQTISRIDSASQIPGRRHDVEQSSDAIANVQWRST